MADSPGCHWLRHAVSATGEKSFFHLKSRKDYQGRDWVEPPASLKKEDLSCYLPKVCGVPEGCLFMELACI